MSIWKPAGADGFRIALMPASRRDDPRGFAATARAVRAELSGTRPFSTLRALVGVAVLDAPESDLFAGRDPELPRRLLIDQTAAREHAAARLGGTADAVLVIVGEDDYGGLGGAGVAAVTRHRLAGRLALHELGHAGFDLADEYGGAEPAASGAAEPSRVNVTREQDPRKVKWRRLVPQNEAVACFEGGDRTDRGIFRASATCRMRSVHDDFCRVCAVEITRIILQSRNRRMEVS